MRTLARYAYTNAKVRAMKGALFSQEQLNGLTSARDCDDLRAILEDTPYKEVFQGQKLPYNPKLIELNLIRQAVDTHFKILKTLKGEPKKIVFLLLGKYEVENLKVVLRLWRRRIPGGEETEHLFPDKICYSLPLRELLSAGTIEEFILLLDGTPYKKPLFAALDNFRKKQTIFYLEAALDIDYYDRLRECVRGLAPIDRKIASRIIGVEVDIENINWLIRFKKYYQMPLGEAISLLIPGGFHLNDTLLRKMYAAENFKDAFSHFSMKPYREFEKLVDAGLDESKLFILETALYEVLKEETKKALTGFPFTIGTVLAYLILKRIESHNVVSLLYSKLYGFGPERSRGSLIC